ncbi:hypothetical protein DVH24_034506, partial [Malus domestica]
FYTYIYIFTLNKDNIGTKDKLNTTTGSFALLSSMLPQDVAKLRNTRSIILGKASLSEWAQFKSLIAPVGWSARAYQGKAMITIIKQPENRPSTFDMVRYGLKGKRLGIVRNLIFTSRNGSLRVQSFKKHFKTLI